METIRASVVIIYSNCQGRQTAREDSRGKPAAMELQRDTAGILVLSVHLQQVCNSLPYATTNHILGDPALIHGWAGVTLWC